MDNTNNTNTYDVGKIEELKPYAQASMVQTGVPSSIIISIAYLSNKSVDEVNPLAEQLSNDRILRNLEKVSDGKTPAQASVEEWETAMKRSGVSNDPKFFDKVNDIIQSQHLDIADQNVRGQQQVLENFHSLMEPLSEKKGDTLANGEGNTLNIQAPAIEIPIYASKVHYENSMDAELNRMARENVEQIFDQLNEQMQRNGQSESNSISR